MLERVSAIERKEILDRVEERAAFYQYVFCGCGRMVVLSLVEEFDLPGGLTALKAASFTCLGIARMGSICGALLGGIIAVGLAAGSENTGNASQPGAVLIDGNEENLDSLDIVQTFFRKCEQEMGGTTCRDIQAKLFGRTYNTLIPEENRQFMDVSRAKCPEKVGRIARFAAEAILDMSVFHKR